MMFSFKTLVLAAIAGTSAVQAMPTAAEMELREREPFNIIKYEDLATLNLQKRTIGGIYICQDVNWVNCGYAVQPLVDCIQLTSPWAYSISSFGPDPGTACVLYGTSDCAVNSALKRTIFNPGNGDLSTIGMNDQIGSWRCWGVDINRQCFTDTLPAVEFSCTQCCNRCDRSGTDCCPSGIIC
ncbi:hypothetical protein TWF694_003461 [Orbilia ellipsospora]|uniref:Uncharacterized protein n=1 Tax=Orbilia ellipsospora TaxID=2528407 RepID=A0AAV9WZF5_9PEZI